MASIMIREVDARRLLRNLSRTHAWLARDLEAKLKHDNPEWHREAILLRKELEREIGRLILLVNGRAAHEEPPIEPQPRQPREEPEPLDYGSWTINQISRGHSPN